MVIAHAFVAPQQLFAIHGHLGGEFFKALDFLTGKLTDMPRSKRGASPRDYAELREAKNPGELHAPPRCHRTRSNR